MDKKKIEKAIYDILEAIGEDPEREGLKDTPQRVSNMYEEIFSGIKSDPKVHLKMFHENYLGNELIVVKDIPVQSMCEHHLLPFVGVVHIAYEHKDNNIIGLSKLSRIVDCYAKRPQVQERLTSQIAEFLYSEMGVSGLGVVLKAEHLCMTMRGVKAIGAKTVTMAFKGSMEDGKRLHQKAISMLLGE